MGSTFDLGLPDNIVGAVVVRNMALPKLDLPSCRSSRGSNNRRLANNNLGPKAM
jgi:hypothetical protein